jgi:hypothetical protein
VLLRELQIEIPLPGWKTVERDEYLKHDLENTPLEIKTDSQAESEEMVDVTFFQKPNDYHQQVGGLEIFLTSPPQYLIKGCTKDKADFNPDPPFDKYKIWRVTLTMVSKTTDVMKSIKKLQVHCNNKKVLEKDLNTCDRDMNVLRWMPLKVKVNYIKFSGGDTASDGYRAYKIGDHAS